MSTTRVLPKGTLLVNQTVSTLQTLRSPINIAVVASSVLPRAIDKAVLYTISFPIMLAAYYIKTHMSKPALVRAQETVATIICLSEIALILAQIVVTVQMLVSVHYTMSRLELTFLNILCSKVEDNFAFDQPAGDPRLVMHTVAVMILLWVAILVDRVAAPLYRKDPRSLRVALDVCLLLMLVTEASPFAIPYAAYSSLDNILRRGGATFPTSLAVSVLNLRAFLGVIMSAFMLLLGVASFKDECRGQTLDSALVVVLRTSSLLSDLVELAKRIYKQSLHNEAKLK